MSSEAVLGNKEFEFVVSEETNSGNNKTFSFWACSLFFKQGLPEVNNFLFIHPKFQLMFAHCLYNNYSYMYSHFKF
jgi:hypothetical protein